MVVETHLHRARDRIDAERSRTATKAAAFATFVDRMERASTTGPAATEGTVPATGVHRGATIGADDSCRRVCVAFDETVRPHVDGDGSAALLEIIGEELSETVAVALAPTTDAVFTTELKARIRAVAETRRTEMQVLADALEREAELLATGVETVETITHWIADAEETPLGALGFDDLHRRHRRLATHRRRCVDLLEDRQEFLRGTTGRRGDVGLDHHSLVAHCYGSFPVDYPLLSTVLRTIETCETCQRAVRRHLVRRV